MRAIVHLSDLHFGRVHPQVIAPMVEAIRQVAPDLVAVSGDLTQRARARQFMEARAFLDRLPMPQIVVPGNHDVPLHNVAARCLQPLRGFRRDIADDLQPFYGDWRDRRPGHQYGALADDRAGTHQRGADCLDGGAALRLPTGGREDRRGAPSLRRAGRP